MIMVLSCFDLVSVATNYSGILIYLISWLKEDCDLSLEMRIYLDFVRVFVERTFDVFLAISIERYMGAYHPIFHRTSITKRRLLTLLAILLIVHTTLYMISTNNMIISKAYVMVVCIVAVISLLVYLNFKLFKFSSEVRQKMQHYITQCL